MILPQPPGPSASPRRAPVRRGRSQRGASLVEYGLLVALIALACLPALNLFGVTNGGSINDTADEYGSATGYYEP